MTDTNADTNMSASSGVLEAREDRKSPGNECAADDATEQEDKEFQPLVRALDGIKPEYRVLVDKSTLEISIHVLRFAVFWDSATGAILRPNYPFLALAESHEESFPSTEPFEFSAATYFMPMTFLLGSAIGSALIGTLSDKVGRMVCILLGQGIFLGILCGQLWPGSLGWWNFDGGIGLRI